MSQSAQLTELAVALAAAQASLNAAKKDATNPHFKSRYATLQAVWDSAREVLAPNGLSVVQTFEPSEGPMMNLTTTLLHKSGQYIAGTLSMSPQQNTPQGIGSAITYARRYALASILGIVADEDDDGNEASHAPASRSVQSERTSSPPPRSAPPASSHAPESNATHGWRTVTVPKFIKKYAGRPLSAMDEKDLLWWSGNYTPKPYNGTISTADKTFRAALTAARLEIAGPAANPPPDTQADNTADAGDEDVPF